MPVHNLFLGRQDTGGVALDVILVTKEGRRSSLHGLEEGQQPPPRSRDGRGDGKAPSPTPHGLRKKSGGDGVGVESMGDGGGSDDSSGRESN
ncbi:unnamed protein product, partial [Laminaria digitata]